MAKTSDNDLQPKRHLSESTQQGASSPEGQVEKTERPSNTLNNAAIESMPKSALERNNASTQRQNTIAQSEGGATKADQSLTRADGTKMNGNLTTAPDGKQYFLEKNADGKSWGQNNLVVPDGQGGIKALKPIDSNNQPMPGKAEVPLKLLLHLSSLLHLA